MSHSSYVHSPYVLSNHLKQRKDREDKSCVFIREEGVSYFERWFTVLSPLLIKWWFFHLEMH